MPMIAPLLLAPGGMFSHTDTHPAEVQWPHIVSQVSVESSVGGFGAANCSSSDQLGFYMLMWTHLQETGGI